MTRLKLMFCAANCLLDSSSGAAISVKTFLGVLSGQGIECRSFTGCVFDNALASDPVKNLKLAGMTPVGGPGDSEQIWVKQEGAVTHWVLPTPTTKRNRLTPDDEERLLSRALSVVEEFRPDALLLYGGGIFERALAKRAQNLGIATFFYLANPTYKSIDSFQNVDQVFTDTMATKMLYEERLGLQSFAIGKFIDKPVIPSGMGAPEHVTFVNPSPEKGVTLFYRIVELARSILPDVRFLVVESRATLRDSELRAGMKFSAFGHVRRIGLQKNIGDILALTRVLLVPSLWHESGGRIAIEACAAGIPAIVSDRGGLPEVLGEAGIFISPPPRLVENHLLIPPLTQAIPWVEAIRQLVTDEAFYRERAVAALLQWQKHDPAFRIKEIVQIIEARVSTRQAAVQR